MLAQLRSLTRGWIARIFLAMIAIALAVTLFQGDFQRGLTGIFNPNSVATVAGEPITPNQLQREFDLTLRAQQQRAQQQGRTISREDAIRAGLPAQLLTSMIGRAAMHALAERTGMHASDSQLADRLRSIPAARDPISGRFSRDLYASFLRDVGYGAGEFEQDTREDIAAEQLLQSLSVGLRPPASYGALVLAFESEVRTVSVAEVSAARIGEIPAPTEAQLQTFYEENADNFRVPEFRALTIVIARAADFAARVNVSDDRVRQEFESRRDSLSQAEKRSFVQVSAPDEAKARQAAEMLGRGADPDQIAQTLGVQVVSQNEKSRAQVADPAVAEAVFGMRPGGAPVTLRARLTPFAAVRLDAVIAARTPTLETEREALRAELALHDGQAQMDRAVEAFDEARSGGQSIAEAARANGLAVITVPAIEQGGRGPDAQPVQQLLDMPSIISTAFETQEGEASDFAPVGEGVDAMVQVDRITPATTRPLAEVREPLQNAWIVRERVRRMREVGDQVAAAVRGGQSFAAATSAARVPIIASSQSLQRQAAARFEDRELASLIFAGNQGDVNVGVRNNGAAALVVMVESVARADLATNRPVAEQFRQQIGEQTGQSFVESIQAAAVASANVSRNQKRLDEMFPSPDAAREQQDRQ